MTFTNWPWRHWCAQRGAAAALRFDDETLSWSTLCQRVDSLAAGLQAQGVRAGDGVALCARNHPQAVLAWLALLQCGARILPLNPRLPASLVSELLPGLTLSHVLNLDGEAHYDLPVLRLRSARQYHDVGWQAERLASMTLTSGSTGLPKAAVHRCAAHLASAEGVLSLMPFSEGDCWLLSLPLFHVSGQGIFWRWLFAGAQMAVSERPLADALSGCTHASLVPTQLWRLFNDRQPLSLKAVLLGGAAIPAALTEQAAARGIRTFCGYGLTEFASTVCAREANGGDDVGTPLPGREMRLVEGEIWLRATSMAAGYWRDGALVPLVNAEGWFATRDRGELHDGRLRVIGRLDNLFFSGGEGVQPEAVERVIAQHPAVNQVFIVPVDDAEFGQRPVAVVDGEAALDLPALAVWAKDKLAGFQQPCRWLRLPETMKGSGIKVSRHQLGLWVAAQFAA
ncbi:MULTISPECIES: o-succinylbenzoate--CoA ligase [Enterobacteriaceae]|uniref:o-succinylbenzoate--CoA ligase n=1 Tax=Enterobacteriaceae TaxID=543 RepID=UPI0015DD257D|nr:o-succinylbenzoate--CoA ligase [Klebsiella sp. WP8-S18-ESBL-06]BBT70248.1 2-succinylbenzoate-CoA ligase [Klebsiella sp. WP8-S18-ESBL-06]